MAVNGTALAAAGAGVVLLWSGLHNASILKATQQIVQGTQPTPGANPTVGDISTGGSTGEVGGGGAPQAPATISGNVALGKKMAAVYGWGSGAQWNALYALWERESGWSNTAENPSSGALGIAQALGHGPTNQYPAGLANGPTFSAAAQIAWGLTYILATYGSPENAWAHETQFGWY
jgi:hypothetical protein